MEFYVTGISRKKAAPDTIRMDLTFTARDAEYAKAYSKGLEKVQNYIDSVVLTNGFTKKDLITSSLNVSLEQEYNEEKRKYEPKGFLFLQNAYLEFPFDMKRLSDLTEVLRKDADAPEYRISFSLKNDRKAVNAAIAEAMKEAKRNAEALAKAAGIHNLRLRKTDLNHSESRFVSMTSYDMAVEESAMATGATMMRKNALADVFTPEEITITQSVVCVYEGVD